MTEGSCPGHTRAEIRGVVGQVESAWKAALKVYREEHGGVPRCDELEEVEWTKDGYEVVGSGSDRVVMGLCHEHVLKVDTHWWSSAQNEAGIWKGAGPELADLLCPVLEVGRWEGAMWTLSPRCTPIAEITRSRINQIERIRGLADVHADNLGEYQGKVVILDYGTRMNPGETVKLGKEGSQGTTVELNYFNTVVLTVIEDEAPEKAGREL